MPLNDMPVWPADAHRRDEPKGINLNAIRESTREEFKAKMNDIRGKKVHIP